MMLSRLVLALSTLLFAVSLSGCARSSDGTVVIPRPLDSRRFWQDDEARRAAAERAQASTFPTGQDIRFVEQEGRPHAAPSRRTAAPASAQADKPLSCRNVAGAGGRVRYVCD
ncbi:hypothetical protein PV773_09530 [Mesorhizobium sp. CC13]|uniref:hypothetical protein n=1 Tax=Mesorhizobium sp. CC13 TaxID=3029194 RepID=UPI0032671840